MQQLDDINKHGLTVYDINTISRPNVCFRQPIELSPMLLHTQPLDTDSLRFTSTVTMHAETTMKIRVHQSATKGAAVVSIVQRHGQLLCCDRQPACWCCAHTALSSYPQNLIHHIIVELSPSAHCWTLSWPLTFQTIIGSRVGRLGIIKGIRPYNIRLTNSQIWLGTVAQHGNKCHTDDDNGSDDVDDWLRFFHFTMNPCTHKFFKTHLNTFTSKLTVF